MSGLSIVSGIALSMGQPSLLTLETTVATSPEIVTVVADKKTSGAKTQVAGLSQWFWQLVAPSKGEKYNRIEIDRPYRF
jgi:hypothetical protein